MEPGGTPAHSPPQYTSRDPSDSISVSMRKRSHDEMSDQNISRISQDSGVVSEIHTEGLSPEPSQNLEVLQQDQPLTPDESAQSHSMLPDQPLEVFDWDLFEANYHEMIRTKEAEEDHLAADFRALCQLFGTWAETSKTREVDRSFKRLRTQSTYVRNEEDRLEERRQHYIKVVNAFQAALSLLNN